MGFCVLIFYPEPCSIHLLVLIIFSRNLRIFSVQNHVIYTQNVCCVFSCSVVSDSFQPCELQPTRLLCPWNFPGKNAGRGSHFLLQGIFPTQGLNPHVLCLLHWQVGSLPLVLPGKPQQQIEGRWFYFFLPNTDSLYLLSCLIALARTSSTMLTEVVRDDILVLFLILGESICSFTINYEVNQIFCRCYLSD